MKLTEQQKLINKFSRFLIRAELRNRKLGKPGFDQTEYAHACGTPACVGGYLNTYPPYRRFIGRNIASYAYRWSEFTGLSEHNNFDANAGGGINRTAFQAANTMRREVGLKAFKSVREALTRG